jgi:hypothetical protein
MSCDLHISANESRCCLGVYGVAVTLQAADAVAACHSCHPGLDSSHACGSPINQRECAGFNWTPFAISTKSQSASRQKPLTSRGRNAKPADAAGSCSRPVACWPHPLMAIESLDVGVGQPVMNAWRGSWSSRSFPPAAPCSAESFQSRDVGVTQPANASR